MKKKILITALVATLVIISAVALVACDNTNLDGKYIRHDQENKYLLINGDTIKYIWEKADGTLETTQSGTFTVDGSELKVTGFEYEVKFEISKDNKTIVMKYVNSEDKTIFNKEN